MPPPTDFVGHTPTSEEDWATLAMHLRELFSPSAPIDDDQLFAGRLEQVDGIVNAVLERGLHVILFGERGVGKTSLVNTFHRRLVRPTRSVLAFRINASPSDDFSEIWRRIFRDLAYSIERNGHKETHTVAELYEDEITPDDVRRELSEFLAHSVPIITIDEYDQIEDENIHSLMANTIKALSDYSVNVTLILVGVANSITELIHVHQSIVRNIIQVRMPRMNRDELGEILDRRIPLLGMSIRDDARDKIVELARGLPSYVHALGLYACVRAIDDRSLAVTEKHADAAVRDCLAKSHLTTRQEYDLAVYSNRADNLYRQVLLACAVADTADSGTILPVSVKAPLSALLGRQVEIANYRKHLAQFCDTDRGSILERSGSPRRYRYFFRDPLMQPFVIMKGIEDGWLKGSASELLKINPQPRLPGAF